MPPRSRTTAGTPSDQPEPLALDLDALEYDGPQGDYPFKLNGRRYVLTSAADLDVNVLGDMQRDPMVFFAQAMSAEDYTAFTTAKLPLFKLRALLQRYTEHYDLGNSGASATS